MNKKLSAVRFACFVVLVITSCGSDEAPGQPAGTAGTGPLGGANATPGASAGIGGGPGTVGGSGRGAAAGNGGAVVPPSAAAGSGAPVTGGSTPGAEGVPEIQGMRGSWASFGGDLEHTRASPNESMISKENVAMLKPAFDIAAPGVTATPAVVNGVIYWADWAGVIHATNLVDQKEIWKADNSANGGGYTGSISVTSRYVYGANRNGLVSAHDRETGETVWELTLDGGVLTHIWSSPIVSEQDNVVVVGMGGQGTRDNGVPLSQSDLETFHGWVQGIDATTGKELWRFETSPAPDGAGVSVWSSAALDVNRKVAYVGTGNNYYRPVSPYSDSMLAIDYMTGELKWSTQFTMNDAWTVGTVLSGGVDGDVGATPNLIAVDGKEYVGVGDKPGRYHLLDRETGMIVWTARLTNGGYQGGVMAPAAYHDGVIYVVSNNDTISSTMFALDVGSGDIKWQSPVTDPTYGGPAYANGVVYVGDQGGNVFAFDAASGMELWTTRLPQGHGGGFSVVDGMLFTGHGYHFSESRQEPLDGGLIAWSTTGTAVVPMGTTMMSDCEPNVTVTSAPTFTNVYQGVLCPAGCTKVCHSTSAEAMLRLEGKDFAYQGLVSVAAKGPSCMASGGMLVAPGDPAASILHGKLAVMPQCGVPMPPTATAATTPVTPAMLEAVRAWIMAGAPND